MREKCIDVAQWRRERKARLPRGRHARCVSRTLIAGLVDEQSQY
jgi:hypothetical protein